MKLLKGFRLCSTKKNSVIEPSKVNAPESPEKYTPPVALTEPELTGPALTEQVLTEPVLTEPVLASRPESPLQVPKEPTPPPRDPTPVLPTPTPTPPPTPPSERLRRKEMEEKIKKMEEMQSDIFAHVEGLADSYLDGTGNEGRLAVVSHGWTVTPPPKQMTYESRSFFPTSEKMSPSEKLANIEEEKPLTSRPESSDSEDYSLGSHIKSAIDYPSAASFAKQFDYFNQPRASIQ